MTYTEAEIKEWFKYMKEKYRNSNSFWHFTNVELAMFDRESLNQLKDFKKTIDK